MDGSRPDAWRYLVEVQDRDLPADATGYRQRDAPRDAGPMPTYAIRFEGPGELALDVVTRLADSHGVDLLGSQTPEAAGDGAVTLDVTVAGEDAAVFGAVGAIDAALPDGATVAVTPP